MGVFHELLGGNRPRERIVIISITPTVSSNIHTQTLSSKWPYLKDIWGRYWINGWLCATLMRIYHAAMTKGPWGPSQYKYSLASIGIPIVMISWFHEFVIFIMGIHIPGKMIFILKQGPHGEDLWMQGRLSLWLSQATDLTVFAENE